MSSMELPGGPGRIDGPNGPERTDPTRKPESVDRTRQAEFERRLAEISKGERTEGADPIRPSAYDEIRAQILSHLNDGASREQVLDRLVGDQLERDFGSRAAQGFALEKVRESASLRGMFDRLLAEVERER
jgi:hypothetical protein